MAVSELRAVLSGAAIVLASTCATAQDLPVGYTLYGTPGLIEMPGASAAPDAEVASTLGGFEDQQRASFTFQITPHLSGTFRYSRLDEHQGIGADDTYDRSFDIHFQAVTETDWRPAIAVGLRDFMGTGLYSGEYVVASKTLTPALRVTGGIGWGRLGSYNGFTNPLGVIDPGFETRPTGNAGRGGVPTYDEYFRGDAALFGGVEWAVSERLVLVAEYSSDAYAWETDKGTLEHNSPLNFGLRYRPRPGYELGAYYLRGSEIGLAATLILNPHEGPVPGGADGAPVPVMVRTQDMRAAESWPQNSENEQRLVSGLTQLFAAEGVEVESIALSQTSVRIRYSNTRYRTEAQVIGRMSRILSGALPPSVEVFTFEPLRAGMAVSRISVTRSDMEELENTPDAAWASLARSRIDEATGEGGRYVPAPQTRDAFEWGIAPYIDLALFDGNAPVRANYGIEGRIRYELSPNLFVTSRLRYQIGGDKAEGAISPSSVHPVRRNSGLYGSDGGVLLESLALHWYDRPGEALYSRVSIGYLEQMFAGVSGELLWKPVDSRLALGAELNYVAQRDYDLGFGFREFTAADGTHVRGIYDVLSGHVSAYYDFENGFHGRVDVGRYLAGDWGATFALSREFENGWTVGAYATFTNVSFDDFGEGSFDKGILFSVPTDFFSGRSSRENIDVNLSSLRRDGGARLEIDGRLYDTVRDGHEPMLAETWGRFWR